MVLLLLTDGTITDIERGEYLEAERRVINELKEINKPFIIVLNSTRPYDNETIKLKDELEEKYMVPVINTNCAQLRIEDINSIMEKILFEFPVSEIGINLPRWVETLEDNHWLKVDMINAIKDSFKVQGISEKQSCHCKI